MKKTKTSSRNNVYFDIWSITHLVVGIIFGWLMSPVVALVILVLWEPLEIFVLSPLLGRVGIIFGFETLRNSLSDIVFDVIGVFLGAYVLGSLITPSFHLF